MIRRPNVVAEGGSEVGIKESGLKCVEKCKEEKREVKEKDSRSEDRCSTWGKSSRRKKGLDDGSGGADGEGRQEKTRF